MYQPVPVAAARQIAISFGKDVVVIICFDHASGHFHTTTYGKEPPDKVHAAELGEQLTVVAGGILPDKTTFEDFRQPAIGAQRIDEMLAAAEELIAHLNERIDKADPTAVPIFHGLARFSAAVNAVKKGQ